MFYKGDAERMKAQLTSLVLSGEKHVEDVASWARKHEQAARALQKCEEERAQEMAKLENFELETYPIRKDPIEQFIEELTGNLETRFMKAKLGENYKYYQKMESVTKNTGIMARIPFDIEVH